MRIYEPAEDSHLLAEAVKKHAFGNVLDVGTGSGIQAETALKNKKVKSVTAVDINKNCSKNLNKKIKFICSNLFQKIPKQKFDTIIFNPPYLPQDKVIEDSSIYGGKKGYETIGKFLDSCNNYLAADGVILLLFSNLSKKNIIDEIIDDNCFDKTEVSNKQLPFTEVLHVYKITKSQLLRTLEKNNVENVKKFSKGHRGIIYIGKLRGKKVAVKAARKDSPVKTSIANEIKWLKVLNKYSIGPKLISNGENYFIYHFVEGEFIVDFIRNCSSRSAVAVLKNILQQCRVLDKLKVTKEEMGRPYKHAIINRNKAVLLDFERCKKRVNPKNVTQFCQFLVSGNFRALLQKKGFKINRQSILAAAKNYKHLQDEESYNKIKLTLFQF